MDREHERRLHEQPLDADDPRFSGSRSDAGSPARARRLVKSQGPGPSPFDRRVRILRVAVPLLFAAGLAVVATVFVVGLDPSPTRTVNLGNEAAVRATVGERPHRVCLDAGQPCAWIDEVGGDLLALSAAGPVRDELGRAGIGWCPSSGYYGSNNTGSRYDPRGRLVEGPAKRGLDRYRIVVRDGQVVVDFTDLRAGKQAHHTTETLPADGPDCERIPFTPVTRFP